MRIRGLFFHKVACLEPLDESSSRTKPEKASKAVGAMSHHSAVFILKVIPEISIPLPLE
jgi:hypothetical protein